MKNPPSILTLAIGLLLAACGPLDKPPVDKPDAGQEDKPTPQRRHIGQIASIDEKEGFVLIRRSPAVQILPGTILVAISPTGQASNLRVSGEALGLLTAADIQSGTPQIGDTVYEPLLDAPSDGVEAQP